MDYTNAAWSAIRAEVNARIADRRAVAEANAANAFAWMIARCAGEHDGVCKYQLDAARQAARQAAWKEFNRDASGRGAQLTMTEADLISKRLAAGVTTV